MFLLDNAGLEIVFLIQAGFHQLITQPGLGAGEGWGRSSILPVSYH